jgi:tetratricopeptide (TPR) repeat protein
MRVRACSHQRFVILVSTLALCAAALPARAEAPLDVARLRAREGQTAYDRGAYREALARFQLAYDARVAPELLFNLAQCHRRLGQLNEAAQLYREFLRRRPGGRDAQRAAWLLVQVEQLAVDRLAGPSEAARAESAEASALAEEAPVIPSTQLEQAPVIPSTQLEQAPVIPATHLESAQAAVRPPAQLQLQLSPLNAAPSAAVAVEPLPPALRERKLWPGLAAGGVSVALLAGGLSAAALSRSSLSELESLHRSGDTSGDERLRHQVTSRANTARALYVSAGVAAVAAGILTLAF